MKNLRIVLFTLLAGLAACQTLDIAPNDRATDVNFWTKPDDALGALNGCYGNLYDAGYFFFNETLSDNAYNRSPVDGDGAAAIAAGAYDGTNGRVQNEWGFHYSGIRKCNNLLANVDKIPVMDAALRGRIKAEARFIRGFHYFQLMTWYGNVPFTTQELTFAQANGIARTDRATVLDSATRDLDFAFANLPLNTQYAADDRGRVTKGAALGLKARLALYEGRWADAATFTQQLIDNQAGTYALFASYAGIFRPENEYNREVILDLQFAPGARTHSVQRYFIPKTEGRLVTSIAPTQDLVDSYLMANGRAITDVASGYDEAKPYEGRDPRLTATLVTDGATWTRGNGSTLVIRTAPGTGDNSVDLQDASPTGYYTYKYFDPTADGNNNSGLNLIMLRYGDVLLMNAEALNEAGRLDAAAWGRTIGALRARAGFTDANALNFPGGTQAQLRDIIRRERRSELAMEGLRIFDLRRWRTAQTALNGIVRGARFGPLSVNNGYLVVDKNPRVFDPAKHYLWPVPQGDVDLNPNLRPNNPGW